MKREPDFSKGDGLIPAIVQNAESGKVLMVGYMNREAYQRTLECQRVTFFSRSRQRLWEKGETSGNSLALVTISVDCDRDAVLVLANPKGPSCHTGEESCFETTTGSGWAFLDELSETIALRRAEPLSGSYTSELFASGTDRLVQKVGEEALEVVIEGKNSDTSRLLSESADLLFHLMVLLESRGVSLRDVSLVLQQRAR
jgi:phosphoribosyl-ATP pyrophosphohydrolase/phosphoribosyl-AMP cyclohydrolase